MKRLAAAALAALFAGPAAAAPLCDNLGFAGLLASCNRGEPITLTLASGQPLGEDGAQHQRQRPARLLARLVRDDVQDAVDRLGGRAGVDRFVARGAPAGGPTLRRCSGGRYDRLADQRSHGNDHKERLHHQRATPSRTAARWRSCSTSWPNGTSAAA